MNFGENILGILGWSSAFRYACSCLCVSDGEMLMLRCACKHIYTVNKREVTNSSHGKELNPYIMGDTW